MTCPQWDEAKIKAIIENKLINKSGSLFKLGVQVVNGRVILEARKRQVQMENEMKEKKLQKKKLDAMGKDELAIYSLNQWCYGGSETNKEGNPKLGKMGTVACFSTDAKDHPY